MDEASCKLNGHLSDTGRLRSINMDEAGAHGITFSETKGTEDPPHTHTDIDGINDQASVTLARLQVAGIGVGLT